MQFLLFARAQGHSPVVPEQGLNARLLPLEYPGLL